MKSSRIEWADWLKFLAIYCVVFGHLIAKLSTDAMNMETTIGLINGVIIAINMPLFAIISGYFFSYKDSCAVFLKKKTLQLLWPLVLWSIIVVGIIPLIKNTYISFCGGEHVHLFATARNIFNNVIDWGWWFLRALYLCFILAFVSARAWQKRPLLALAISNVLFVSLAWSGVIPNMDNKLKGFFFLYPFFCMGFVLKHYDEWLWRRQIFLLSCLSFLICLLFWRGEPDSFYGMNTSLIKQTGYENIVGVKVVERSILRFVIGLAGSLTCIISLRILNEKFEKISTISSFISKVGQSTLGIYILHGFVLDFFVNRIVSKESSFLTFIICFVISLALVMACSFLYQLSLRSKFIRLVLWGKT